MTKVDKQLELEKYLHDIVGDEEFMSSKEYQDLLDKETDSNSERYKILDLLCWMSDKKDELERAKNTLSKYKGDTNKSFNYIFYKLPTIIHMNKEAMKVLEEINRKALEAYMKVLEYSIKDRELNIQEWQKKLDELND